MRKSLTSFVLLFAWLCAAPALARPQYPIKPADYRKTINARIEAIWGKIEHKLDFNKVTPDRKRAIRRVFDDAASEVWAEVSKASADGNITRDEALKVRALTSELRGKVKNKLAAEKKASKTARKAATKTLDKAAKTPDKAAKAPDKAARPHPEADKTAGAKSSLRRRPSPRGKVQPATIAPRPA